MHHFLTKSRKENSTTAEKKSSAPSSKWFKTWNSHHSQDSSERKAQTLPSEYESVPEDPSLTIKRVRTASDMFIDASLYEEKPATSQTTWDEASVDVEASEQTLQSLKLTMQQERDHLAKIMSERRSHVHDFLHNAHDSKARTSFEETNQQSKKQEQAICQRLDFLEHCYDDVLKKGIPKGENPKEYLKSLRKKMEGKVNEKVMEGLMKSATPQMTRRKKSEQSPVSIKVESTTPPIGKQFNLSTDESGKVSISKRDLAIILVSSTQTSNSSSSLKPPESGVNSSQSGDRGHGHRRIRSNDIQCLTPSDASSVGRQRKYSAEEDHEGNGAEHERALSESLNENQYSHVAVTQLMKISEELQSLRSELRETVDVTRRIEAELICLRLDGETTKELYRQRLDAISRRVEVNEYRCETLNSFKEMVETTIANYKERFEEMEGKFDYGMSATSRRLRDNSEGIVNKIHLLEGRMNNIYKSPPTSSSWSFKETGLLNHLITSALHIVAFIAIVLSSGLNFLMSILNRYNRLSPLPRRLVLTAVTIVGTLLCLYTYHEDFQNHLNNHYTTFTNKILSSLPFIGGK